MEKCAIRGFGIKSWFVLVTSKIFVTTMYHLSQPNIFQGFWGSGDAQTVNSSLCYAQQC